jgi:hypothetical protein
MVTHEDVQPEQIVNQVSNVMKHFFFVTQIKGAPLLGRLQPSKY